MLKVTSNKLELRGVSPQVNKKGNQYYLINAESEDGTPYQFYCPNVSALPAGLKKGDPVVITFDVKYFNLKERLEVCVVQRAN